MNPSAVSAFAAVVAAVAAAVAACSSVWLANLSQKQVSVSQKQVSVAEQQIFDQHRPLLVPKGVPIFSEGTPWLKWDHKEMAFDLLNVGPGPALNIAAVLHGCSTYVLDDAGEYRDNKQQNFNWTVWSGIPIASSDAYAITMHAGGSLFLEGHRTIGGQDLNAPEEPAPYQLRDGTARHYVARMVITYHDVFGRKHASIADFDIGKSVWQITAVCPDIPEDLDDIKGLK